MTFSAAFTLTGFVEPTATLNTIGHRSPCIYRAKEAIRKAEADLGVGLEGGVAKRAGRYFLTGWCAVVDVGGDIALGCGGGIELPEVIVREVLSGKELGDVMDEVTGISGTKRKMGAVGILTNGLTSRQESWEFTLLYAMARKLSAELYSKMDRSEL
jgi:inosine/xanthosine triphosphatase